MFLVIGIILIVIGIVFMGRTPGPAFLIILLGLVFDVIGLIKSFKNRKKQKRKKTVSKPRPVRRAAQQYDDQNYSDPVPQRSGYSSYSFATLFSRKDFKEFNSLPYIVFDVETTGLSPATDEIIELAMLKVFPDKQYKTYHSLFKPPKPLSKTITDLTGITDEMLESAPNIDTKVEEIRDFIGDTVLVAHNARFDCSFLVNLFNRNEITVSMTAIDTVRMAKQAFPGMKNYKLDTLIQEFELKQGKQSHRATDDVICTQRLLSVCIEELAERRETELSERREEKKKTEEERYAKYHSSPLFNTAFVFTGDFSVSREKIEEIALSVGGLVRQAVNTKTDFLVVGDVSNLPDWALARKKEKAEALADNGEKVRLISESEFFDMVNWAMGEF